jgi:UDP-N-acetylmuramyl pentapeptide phosphotransferase/UDP-N-acetylglucosamine-1-phosphate transferase
MRAASLTRPAPGPDWVTRAGATLSMPALLVFKRPPSSAFMMPPTAATVVGAVSAVDVIDGYNGLASVVLGGIGALLGLFVWTWPRGLIFMGDGGAYFVGYLVAVLSFLLVAQHCGVVTPWYAFLLFIYAVFETLFSIWRKRVVRGDSPSVPDGPHLPTLVLRRLVRWAARQRDAASLTQPNSLSASSLWLLSSLAALPATLFCVRYVWLYLRPVRFPSPRWLVIRSRPGGPLSRFKDRL